MASAIWVDDSRNTDDDVGAYLALGKATEKYNFELSAWGYKLSGFGGRDNGMAAFDQYTEIKTIWVPYGE